MDPLTLVILLVVGIMIFFVVRTRKSRAKPSKPLTSSTLAYGSVGAVVSGMVLLFFGSLSSIYVSLLGGLLGIAGLVILVFMLCGLIADMAEAKGRSWGAFFLLSLLFSPLIMWVIAATMSPLPGSTDYVAPPRRSPSSIQTSEDFAKQIRDLGTLRDQGLITDEEFEKKKQQVLERI